MTNDLNNLELVTISSDNQKSNQNEPELKSPTDIISIFDQKSLIDERRKPLINDLQGKYMIKEDEEYPSGSKRLQFKIAAKISLLESIKKSSIGTLSKYLLDK